MDAWRLPLHPNVRMVSFAFGCSPRNYETHDFTRHCSSTTVYIMQAEHEFREAMHSLTPKGVERGASAPSQPGDIDTIGRYN